MPFSSDSLPKNRKYLSETYLPVLTIETETLSNTKLGLFLKDGIYCSSFFLAKSLTYKSQSMYLMGLKYLFLKYISADMNKLKK